MKRIGPVVALVVLAFLAYVGVLGMVDDWAERQAPSEHQRETIRRALDSYCARTTNPPPSRAPAREDRP